VDSEKKKAFGELGKVELIKLTEVFTDLVDIGRYMDDAISEDRYDKPGLQQKLEKWLEEVRDIAHVLDPNSLTVGAEAGFPTVKWS